METPHPFNDRSPLNEGLIFINENHVESSKKLLKGYQITALGLKLNAAFCVVLMAVFYNNPLWFHLLMACCFIVSSFVIYKSIKLQRTIRESIAAADAENRSLREGARGL